MRHRLHGLTAGEIGADFDLTRMLNHGCLPRIYQSARPRRLLDAYVSDYLKEEVAAEGLVRNLPNFAGFLEAAAHGDGGVLNYSNIARDCGVSSHTVRSYFDILEDTLLGRRLPCWRRRPKRRLAGAPKFYFADMGMVNRLARRGELLPGSELYGKAFENWVFHELSACLDYTERDEDLACWRLSSGAEVDFIVGDMRLAIEAKASARITSDHLKGLRNLAADNLNIGRRLLMCLESRPRRTEDGIDILPAQDFAGRLWEGRVI